MLTNIETIILASASPRRSELLTSIGLKIKIVPSDIDETLEVAETPVQHVARLAQEKATFVAKDYPSSWIIGADTIVVLDNNIIGKPTDKAHAKSMLKSLSNKTHIVYTGFAIINLHNNMLHAEVVESAVTLRFITDDELNWYINTPEPYDKAGAYALQGKGAVFVKSISGSHSNIIGLPISEVTCALKAFGAINFTHMVN